MHGCGLAIDNSINRSVFPSAALPKFPKGFLLNCVKIAVCSAWQMIEKPILALVFSQTTSNFRDLTMLSLPSLFVKLTRKNIDFKPRLLALCPSQTCKSLIEFDFVDPQAGKFGNQGSTV